VNRRSPLSATESAADQALLHLLLSLARIGYDFVTPTQLTHERVIARRLGDTAHDLRDALGWSLPFRPHDLPSEIVSLLEAAQVLRSCGNLARSTIRVSRVRGLPFIHSAYPPNAADAVFLGPDSYRFAEFIAQELAERTQLGRVADIGGGAGVGILTAAAGRSNRRLFLSDVNPRALRFARVSAAHAGIRIELVEARGADALPDEQDLLLANPPFIGGDPDQVYQNGGGNLGLQASLEWAEVGVRKLSKGGRLLLYSGSAIRLGGRDALLQELQALAARTDTQLRYREIDPDIFGEELEQPAYMQAERIAAVGAVLTRPR